MVFERLLHALGLIIGEGLSGSPNATVIFSNEFVNLQHLLSGTCVIRYVGIQVDYARVSPFILMHPISDLGARADCISNRTRYDGTGPYVWPVNK